VDGDGNHEELDVVPVSGLAMANEKLERSEALVNATQETPHWMMIQDTVNHWDITAAK